MSGIVATLIGALAAAAVGTWAEVGQGPYPGYRTVHPPPILAKPTLDGGCRSGSALGAGTAVRPARRTRGGARAAGGRRRGCPRPLARRTSGPLRGPCALHPGVGPA